MCGLNLSQFAKYWMIPGHMIIKLSTVLLEVVLVQTGLLLEFGSLAPLLKSVFFYSCGTNNFFVFYRPSLKSALPPPPSALAESANFRPFYVKRAEFSPPPPATKKRRKLVKIRPRCPHLATKKRRKVVKIRPCGGWWVGGWPPPFY